MLKEVSETRIKRWRVDLENGEDKSPVDIEVEVGGPDGPILQIVGPRGSLTLQQTKNLIEALQIVVTWASDW